MMPEALPARPASPDGHAAAPRLGPLLAGTAMLALALGAGMARGQTFIGNGIAFQGTASTALGNVSLASGNAAGGPTDTLTVHTPTAIIDWHPYDDDNNGLPAMFLPAGSTGVFQNGTEVSGFTVLNRINPGEVTKPIQFDGHVISQLIDADGVATRGGNVWFQAPGGIIIGATGKFDVGSLILTTNAIDTQDDTALPDPASGIGFAGPDGSTAGVTLQPGAQIAQPVAGSYLAIVAPRIDQGGTVSVNGSVGYVAAQAADITINAGLFNIAAATGSTVESAGETTLSHTGSTTGPAQTSSAAPHVIYMVAVPANDAVTLLASGTAGYDAAADASMVNGSVVLTSGIAFNANPQTAPVNAIYGTIGSDAPGNISIPGGRFTSSVNARSTGMLDVTTSAGDIAFTDFFGAASFAFGTGSANLHVTGDHSLTSTGAVDIESGLGSVTGTVDAGGTLTVGTALTGRVADAQTLQFDVAGRLTTGSLTLESVFDAENGIEGTSRLGVTGQFDAGMVTLLAIGQGGTNSATVTVSDGGTATVGSLFALAGTTPLIGIPSSQVGGSARGGTVDVSATSGGTLTITAGAKLDAAANAPSAGSTTGGTARLTANGGTIVQSGADGGILIDASATGGTARGGTATLLSENDGAVRLGGGLGIMASANNTVGASVAALGGFARLSAVGASIAIDGATTIDARGIATAVSDAATPGYDAQGGTAAIGLVRAEGGDTPGTATFGGMVTLDASALSYQGSAVATGNARGGTARVRANDLGNATLSGGLLLDSSANANSVGTDPGIVSAGGTSTVDATGGTISLTGVSPTSGLEIASDAQGGTATGGTTTLSAQSGGTITATSTLSIHASGFGGSLADGSIAGYAGTGGSTAVTARDGTITLTNVDLMPLGAGGNSTALEGGAGTGGTASIATTDPAGRITISGYANLEPDGTAGTGATGTANGRGGASSITATSGSIAFTATAASDDPDSRGYAIYAIADGTGSAALTAGRDPATAGIGYGGTVTMVADAGGTISVASNVYLSPYGNGGRGPADGAGGRAVGGGVTLATRNGDGEPGRISVGSMLIDNGAFGGFGDTGGSATAGTSEIDVADGTAIAAGLLTAQTYATGGFGTTIGGAATGGSTTVRLNAGTLTIGGDSGVGTLDVTAFATGGGGATGGAASGSAASILVDGGTLVAPVVTITASTTGGAAGGVSDFAVAAPAAGPAAGGAGGAATGGSAILAMTGGSVSVPSLSIGTAVTGGAGGTGGGFVDDPSLGGPAQSGFAGGAGGVASGGTARLTLTGGTLSASDVTVGAATLGGAGGQGGDGAGSDASGTATGGAGGVGGSATGNGATLSVTGGTLTAATSTTVTSSDNAGAGGTGGIGGTNPVTGTRTQAASGAAGPARGGDATIATDRTGVASLGATALHAGGTVGTTIEAGTITLAARDSDGSAPAAPLTLAGLTATMDATTTAAGDGIQVTAAAPIAIAGDATVSGFAPARFDMTGRGTLTVGGALRVDTLDVTGTQTGASAGTIAIAAGSASLNASAGAITLATLATTSGSLSLTATQAIAGADLASAGDASLVSGGSIGLGRLIAARDIDIDAGGALSAATLTSTHGAIDATAAGSSAITTVAAGGEIEIVAGGAARYGTVTAGTDPASPENDGGGEFGSVALVAGGDLLIDGGISAYRSIGLVAGGALSAPSLVAANGGSVGVLAGGGIALGTVTAPDLFYVGGPGAIAGLDPDATAAQIVATLRAAGPVASGGAVTIAQATTGSATVSAGTTLTLDGPLIATTGSASLAAVGDLVARDVTAVGAVSAASSGGATTIGTVQAGQPTIAGGIRLTAAQAVTAGPLVASGSVAVASSGGALRLQDVTSSGGGVSAMAGGGDIALGTVRAAGSIAITGTGRITAGDLTAGTGPLLPGESGGGGGATDPAVGGIAGGFDGAAVDRCDDCSTSGIALPFTLNYFGRTYSTAYVSNNGYLTFDSGQGLYTPGGLGTGYAGQPIIAAFFADVDTRNPLSAQTTYGSGTFAGRQAFGATWNGVGYFASQADKLNNFQIILTNRADTGTGNFDVYYNYTNIGWETGSASGGSNGFGGTSAAVGYNAGTGNQAGTFFELPGSRVPGSFINGGTAPLATGSNDGIAGQLLFTVRNGVVSAAPAAGPPSIHVSNLGGSAPADIRLGNLSAEGAEVHGSGQVTVGNVDVGDRGSGIAAVGQPFATVLDAGLGLSAADVTSTGLIVLGSRAGDVSAGTITGGASVMALADGSVTLGRVTTGTAATDTLYLGGAATDALTGFGYTTLLSGRTFDPATLAVTTPAPAGGAITVAGPIATGNLRGAANGALTIGATTATATVDLSAGGTLTLASIDAAQIALASPAIAIATDATIGSSRTGAVTFTNTGTGRTAIGDATGAGEGDYALSAATLAAVHGHAITVATQAQGGDTLIGDLTLRGRLTSGANLIGDAAGFTVTSPNAIRIVGAARFTGLADDTTVTLRSTAGGITGVLPAGSVTLDDGAGALAGTLALDARTILFATPAAASALASATTPVAADAALGDPGTLANPAGYLRADTVSLRFADALYIQNSGATSALADRAGITAGRGGIRLAPGSASAPLVLNARLEQDGTTLTGDRVYTALALSPSAYGAGSTVNSCLLDGSNCGVVTPPQTGPISVQDQAISLLVRAIQPVQDVVAQVRLNSSLGNAAAYSFTSPVLVSAIDLSPPAIDPQIDEPVTGAGNESLWVNIGVGRELAPMGGKPDGARP